MPFTVSHAAAVLPLLDGVRARGPLVASALVAGSMAPDVPFFAASLLPGVYRLGGPTHRWWAVATVDVALAAGLVAAWHGLLRGPLVALLPPGAARAAEAASVRTGHGPSARRAGWFAVSAALGAATHVGWDGFTHEGRCGVRLLPVLDRRVAGLPLYGVLQHGCSVAGLGWLTRYAVRAAGRLEPVRPSVELPRGWRPAVAALLGAATAAGAAQRLARRERNPVNELCFGAGAGLAAGAVGYATAARLRGRRDRRTGGRAQARRAAA
ncbi:DUF4184 family protein [Kitasatospora sp. NBC_00315]|uniref:DUF4184 family protein n=1 Tax=Kitasatospora sp. NBC_00315 TaxID=2975963 RepID=UPI0032464238